MREITLAAIEAQGYKQKRPGTNRLKYFNETEDSYHLYSNGSYVTVIWKPRLERFNRVSFGCFTTSLSDKNAMYARLSGKARSSDALAIYKQVIENLPSPTRWESACAWIQKLLKRRF